MKDDDDVSCCLVADRTWMPTMMMMRITVKMRGSIITLLPPLVGMIPETTRSRLLTCALTVTPRTIIRAPMSTVGIALCHPPCLCEKTQRSPVCVCLCVNMCACMIGWVKISVGSNEEEITGARWMWTFYSFVMNWFCEIIRFLALCFS